MTCLHNKREIKCKFPPCPCQKCAQSSGANNQDGGVRNRCCRDTPPERPIPKYQFQPKCPCKLEQIGPKYQRKYPLKQTAPPRTCCEEKKECVEGDDCYTGIGCCNTERNFLTFMINLIGYLAFVIISALVFWLIVCHWVVVLGFKVYNAKRPTQIAVVSVIALLLVFVFCTAGWKAFRTKTHLTVVQSTRLSNQTSNMFSFHWRRAKEPAPAKSESRSWFSYLKRGQSKNYETTNMESSSWLSSLKWSHSKPPKQFEQATSSTWLPAFKWRRTTTKEIEHPSPNVRSSWMPSYFTRGQATTTKKIEKTTETRTYWKLWRTFAPTQTLVTKAEARGSWLPSFKWGYGTPKKIEKQPERRTSWLSWRRRSTPAQTQAQPVTRFSWIPSLNWSRKESDPTLATVELRSTWTSYFARQKAPPPTTTQPKSHSGWTSYLQWHKTAPQSIEKQSKETEKRSWFYSFKWGQSKEIDVKVAQSDGRAISWLPSFNCGRSQDLQTSHGKAEKSSWLPSFNWGRQSANQKSASCKTGCNPKSACGMRKQEVTVSVDDPEAQRVFKQSKFYAIPTEMKHPPKLVVFLRDHLIQSSA